MHTPAEIRTALEKRHGPLPFFELIPSTTEGRPFHDLARTQLAGRSVLVKWHGDGNDSYLRREYSAGVFLQEHGLPIARMIAWHDDPPFFVMEELPGRVCTPSDITPQIAATAANLLRQLHSIPEAEALAAGIRPWAGATFREECAKRYAYRAPDGPSLFGEEWSMVASAIERLLIDVQYEAPRTFCRRDIHEGNWFIRDDGILCIIDHANSIVARPANDLWKIRHSFAPTAEAVAAFREAYGAPAYDAATSSDVDALLQLLYCLEILYWMRKKGNEPENALRILSRVRGIVAVN